jgi:hypothetical protein
MTNVSAVHIYIGIKDIDEELDDVSSKHSPGTGEIEYLVRGSNITPVWKRRPLGR